MKTSSKMISLNKIILTNFNKIIFQQEVLEILGEWVIKMLLKCLNSYSTTKVADNFSTLFEI